MPREDQLNRRIATIIRECVRGAQWGVSEENDGALSRSNRRPDILVTRPWPEPPVVIENEYNVANIERGCLNKLGQAMQPTLGGQTINTVIGVHSPKELRDAANGDQAEAMLRDGAKLRYVAYVGTPDDFTLFPKSGFITGDVRNLVEFVRPAAEPADLIRQAADLLANGAAVAAHAIVKVADLLSLRAQRGNHVGVARAFQHGSATAGARLLRMPDGILAMTDYSAYA